MKNILYILAFTLTCTSCGHTNELEINGQLNKKTDESPLAKELQSLLISQEPLFEDSKDFAKSIDDFINVLPNSNSMVRISMSMDNDYNHWYVQSIGTNMKTRESVLVKFPEDEPTEDKILVQVLDIDKGKYKYEGFVPNFGFEKVGNIIPMDAGYLLSQDINSWSGSTLVMSDLSGENSKTAWQLDLVEGGVGLAIVVDSTTIYVLMNNLSKNQSSIYEITREGDVRDIHTMEGMNVSNQMIVSGNQIYFSDDLWNVHRIDKLTGEARSVNIRGAMKMYKASNHDCIIAGYGDTISILNTKDGSIKKFETKYYFAGYLSSNTDASQYIVLTNILNLNNSDPEFSVILLNDSDFNDEVRLVLPKPSNVGSIFLLGDRLFKENNN